MGQSAERRTAGPWRTASASGGGNCINIAEAEDGILVRDSKNPDGPALFYGRSEWRAFMTAVKSEGLPGRPL